MRDILVTEDIVGQAMNTLRGDFDVVFDPDLHQRPKKIMAVLGEFRAVIVRNQTMLSAPILATGKSLEVIGRAGVGLDNIDTESARNGGVVVVYAPEQNSISVAELAIGLMLALARKVCIANRGTKDGHWPRRECMGAELYGKTLGVIGLGRIGFLTAMRAKALGMDIIVHDPLVNPDAAMVVELRARMLGIDELMGRSDIVTCHLPATAQTRGCISDERISLMKPGAFLINTSRGEVVDEAALIRGLREKRIGGAALDVRQTEPPGKDVLCEMENVILTPHVGGFTHEAQERVVNAVCRDVAAVLRGEAATNFVHLSRPRPVD